MSQRLTSYIITHFSRRSAIYLILMNASGRLFALLVLFLSFSLTGLTQTTPQIGSPASERATDQVVFSTTVIDKKGNLVTGLQRDNFQVSIDKRPANIIDFGEEDFPLSVGLIFDDSASVGYRRSVKATRALINSAQQGLKSFLDMSHPLNEYFLMAISNSPRLLLDWTSDSKAITDTLDVWQPKGNTAFYDACYMGIDKLRLGSYSKRVLILITDGKDSNSTYSFTQVRNKLQQSNVLVYSVFLGTRIEGSSISLEGQEILDDLSVISGGRLFWPGETLTASEGTSIFEKIASELRHQYTIAVTPNVASDNIKWHKIKIKVSAAPNAPDEMKHLSARTRDGFYLNHR